MSEINQTDERIEEFILRVCSPLGCRAASLPEVVFLFLEKGLDPAKLFLNLSFFDLGCCKAFLRSSELKFTVEDLLEYLLKHKEPT